MSIIKIKHRYTDAVLFEHETTDDRIASGLATRDALEAASKAGANLAGAKLDGANLARAYLAGAKLVGTRPVLMIGPIGSRSAYLTAYSTDKGLRILTGCFFGSDAEFAAAVEKTHASNEEHLTAYRAALVFIRATMGARA